MGLRSATLVAVDGYAVLGVDENLHHNSTIQLTRHEASCKVPGSFVGMDANLMKVGAATVTSAEMLRWFRTASAVVPIVAPDTTVVSHRFSPPGPLRGLFGGGPLADFFGFLAFFWPRFLLLLIMFSHHRVLRLHDKGRHDGTPFSSGRL
jgi:hypothetical protein